MDIHFEKHYEILAEENDHILAAQPINNGNFLTQVSLDSKWQYLFSQKQNSQMPFFARDIFRKRHFLKIPFWKAGTKKATQLIKQIIKHFGG